MVDERVWLEVDLQKLKNNVSVLKKWQGKEICAVIKANAYGLGVIKIAEAIENLVSAYGVATVEEGIQLRKRFKKKNIFVLGKMLSTEISNAVKYSLTITIDSFEDAEIVNAESKLQNTIACVQVAVDTGMSRIGIKYDNNFFKTAQKIFELPDICVMGVFSHFADSDENEPLTFKQTSKFIKVKLGLQLLGCKAQYYHICNSGGCLNLNANFCNMTRIGIAMYGICCKQSYLLKMDNIFNEKNIVCNNSFINREHCEESELNFQSSVVDDLQGVATLYSRILKIFYAQKGQGISYGHTYIAPRKMRIAVVGCGYADGYPIALSNKGYAIVDNHRAKIVGKVCMDMFMLDVSNIVSAGQDSKVLLWESDMSSSIPLKKLSKMCYSSEYEMLTRLGNRVKRIYIQY